MIQLVSYAFTTIEDPLSNGGTFTTVADTTFTGNLKVPSSGICEPHAITVNQASFYSGAIPVGDTGGTWPSDHYSETTLTTLSSGFTTLIVRQQAAGSGTQYLLNIPSPFSSGQICQLFAIVANVQHLLTNISGQTIAASDVWRLSVTGNVLTVSRNGSVVSTFTDTNNYIPSGGNPGLGSGGSVVITDSQVSLWAAGANQAAVPTFSPNGGTIPQTVTLTSPNGGKVYYTLDGSTPTRSSASVNTGGTVRVNLPGSIKAISSATNFADSPVATSSAFTPPANTFVQGFANTAGGGILNPYTATFPSNVTKGNLLVIAVRHGTEAAGIASINGTLNTANWNLVFDTVDVSTNTLLGWAWVFSAASGPETVQVHYNSAPSTNGTVGCIAEYHGPNAARTPFPAANTPAAATSIFSNSLTVQAGDLVIGQFESNSPQAPASVTSAGFTVRESGKGGDLNAYCWLTDALSAAGGAAQSNLTVPTLAGMAAGIGGFYFNGALVPGGGGGGSSDLGPAFDFTYHF